MYDFLYIKNGGRLWKIPILDILYLEADNKYTKVVTLQKVHLTLQSLSAIESLLPTDQFCRIHRSFIISLAKIDSISNTIVYIGNTKLPIGKQYKAVLHSRILAVDKEGTQSRKLSPYDLLKLFRRIGFN